MTTRRRVIRLTAAGVAVGATGCLHGGGSEGDGGEDGSEGEDGMEEEPSGDGETTDGEKEEMSTKHEPWASFGRDLGNTSYAPNASPPDGNELWSFTAGNPVYGGAAVVDGTVYFGSLDNSLYAVGADSGSEEWSFETDDTIQSTPAVGEENVYVGSDDNSLYAVSLGGSRNWAFEDDNPIRASPKIAEIEEGSIVLTGADRGSTGESVDRRVAMRALDTEGEEVWTFRVGEFIANTPAVSGNKIYVPRSDGVFYCIDLRSGEQNWLFNAGVSGGELDSAPAVGDGGVYLGNSRGRLYALEDDPRREREMWSYDANDAIRTSPAVADGTVYFGDDSGTLYAVSTDGEEEWTFEAGGQIRSSPAVGDGYVCFGSGDDNVYGVSTDGEELWRFETGASVRSPPAIIDGRVYIGGVDSNLYAIE